MSVRRRRRSSVQGVNRPVINYPGAQAILLSSAPLVFASSISVSDAVETSLTVQLTFTGGTITLDGTTGLSFSVGDGTADATMTFSGTITNINNALSGMSVTAGSTGDRTLAIVAMNTTGSRNASVAVQFGAVPVFTVDPAISGDTDYGNVLTCSNGTVTGYPTPTLTRQWQNDGVNISGETGATYTSVFGDVGDDITCEVTATNAYGSGMAETAALVIVDPDAFAISDLTVEWVSITSVNVGYVDGEIQTGDFLEFQIDTVNTFDSGDLEEVSEELDSGEISGGSFEAILPPLGAGNWYIRVRVRRGSGVSAWSATDLIDYAAPTLSSTSPTDNATDIAIDGNLTATFNENIAFGTGNITLRKNDGGWTDVEAFNVATEVGTDPGEVSISGAVLTINPTSDLENDMEYSVRIDATAIDDTSGNSFAGIADDTTWSFTTEASAAVAWTPSTADPAIVNKAFAASNHTFTGIDFLAGLGIVMVAQNQARTFTGVTVNGNAATLVAQTSTSTNHLSIWKCVVASPGSYSVVVTGSGTLDQIGLATGTLVGANATETDTAYKDYATGNQPHVTSSSITVPTDGIGLAFFSARSAAATTWSVGTEQVDKNNSGGSNNFTVSSAYMTADGTPSVTTHAFAGTTMVAAAWGP